MLVAWILLLAATMPARSQDFSISSVAFPASAYLSESDLQEIAARYTGRSIVFADLQAMLAEVQGLYDAAGIVTAQAILPPQDIVDGTLRVELIEAVVESVEIVGFERTNPAFLRRNIGVVEGELPDFERLERDLRIFDISHDISPRLSFGTGGAPGTTRVLIDGDEPATRSWVLSFDNFGREETGVWRASAFMSWASVSGRRDILSLQTQFARGSRLAGAGYSIPTGTGGGRVIATASHSRADIVAGEFEVINIVTRSDAANIAYSRPFGVSAASHWMLDTGVGYERNVSSTTGLAFSDIRIAEVHVGATYSRQFARSSLRAGIGSRVGNAKADGTTETEGAFWLLSGHLNYAHRATQSLVFEADVTGQFARNQNLPVARLFTVGGPTTMRGYPINVRGGDSGVMARLQLSLAEQVNVGNFGLRPFAFLDSALVVPFRQDGGIDTKQDLLASVGGGLRMRYRDNVAGLLVVGVPLLNTQGFTNTGRPTAFLGIDYQF